MFLITCFYWHIIYDCIYDLSATNSIHSMDVIIDEAPNYLSKNCWCSGRIESLYV